MRRYSSREYWNKVANELDSRDGDASIVAGDDTAFYRVKRELFLQQLLGPAIGDAKAVLEVGSGPGGNLNWLKRRMETVVGADVSETMIKLARRNGVQALVRIDGSRLPFRDRSCEAVFSATVLQHNPPEVCIPLIREMARVCGDQLHLFEDTAPVGVRDRRSHWLRRPNWYATRIEPLGFRSVVVERLPLTWQETAAVVSRGVVARTRHEGEAVSETQSRLERNLLRAARLPDRVLPATVGLTRMSFRRTS
jgi:SAM-dependent methyltransferase